MHPCLWFAALSVVILHSGGASAAAPSALLTLDTAEVAVRLDGEPAFGPSVPAALPHNWDRLYPGRSGRAVYRITLPSPAAADASYAVYLSRVGSRFEAFAGGVVIARFGQSDEYANFAGQPVVLAVPQRALTEDRILELRVSVDAMARGGVAPLLFGTEQEIRSHASGEAWGRTYVPLMTLAVLGLLIALSLVLWIKTREPLYGYFVGLAAAWVVRIGSGFITHPPLGLTLWSALYFAAYPLYAGFLFLFTVELFSLKRVIHRPAITCIMLAALAGAMLAVLTGMPAIYTVTVGLLALAGTYYYALVASVTFKQPSVERWLFLTAGGLNVVAGLRDWLVIRLDPGGLGVVDWSRQTVFLFNFVMAGIIVNRFIKSLRAYQLLNADLAQRIALRETELARAYDERRAIEQAATLLSERQRIMRDMHDGIGAQLVSMLNALRTRHVDAREIEQQVQESLDQLRLTIDSLEPVEGDLATVLGHLRFRLGKRFEASGILLDWQVEPLPALDYLTPANVAHIQKIVIEAFTNIVKHARASRVRLSARAAADRIEIEIEDDGRGRTGAESGGGRGIENMRFRAQAVGAQFSIGFRSQGTVVALALPLQKPV